MVAEAGHEPNPVYRAQDGSLHLNGGGLYDSNEVDISARAGNVLVSLMYGEATPLDQSFVVVPRAYVVTSINGRPLVVGSDGGSVVAVVKKVASGTAIASGTALHTGNFDLKGTINTNQALTLEATANITLAAGDAIGIDCTGTMTAARGCITLELRPA